LPKIRRPSTRSGVRPFGNFEETESVARLSRYPLGARNASVRYELFVDMGEGDGEARSVKRTRINEAFPLVGTKLRFLFDYGDEWVFLVELLSRKPMEPKVRLPRLLNSVREAPVQYEYPDPEDE